MDGRVVGMDSGTTGRCATMGPEDTAGACSNGCDDDFDGFSDCADFECEGVGACGLRDASIARCDGSTQENSASSCSNGCDDDGDGFIDCADRSCRGLGSCPIPDGSAPLCDGGGNFENTVASCSDGCDNDRDGFVDCADFNCTGIHPCPGDGGFLTCSATSEAENTPSACADGCSNDGDRFVDCDDRDCAGIGTCPAVDAGSGSSRMRCDGASVPENTAERCSDGCSNDSDTFVDCDDFDCAGLAGCAGRDAGTGSSRMRCDAATVPENTAERCSDGCSNDSDTFVDCDDFDCAGLGSCPARDAGPPRDSGA